MASFCHVTKDRLLSVPPVVICIGLTPPDELLLLPPAPTPSLLLLTTAEEEVGVRGGGGGVGTGELGPDTDDGWTNTEIRDRTECWNCCC